MLGKYSAVGVCLLLCASLLLSCSEKDEVKPDDPSYDYAPMLPGTELIYSVDSVVYNDFSFPVTVDTFRYFVKNEIGKVEHLQEGAVSYKVVRYLKKDSLSDWILDRAFTIRKNNKELVEVDENLPIVLMVFPAKEEKEWDANAYNTLSEKEYKYRNVHHATQVNSHYFDHSLEVLQHERKNLLEDERSVVKYAAGVGMINKQERFLKTNFQGDIKSGYELHYSLMHQ